MAKLSARGRKELARVEKEYHSFDLPQDSLTDWQRTSIALMSDGAILKKIDVRFKSDGRKHSYGWKKYGKLKAGNAPEVFVNAYLKVGYLRAS